jgi:hypothetical protein
MSGTHSILAPSSAHIWMQCAASVRMQLPYANDPPTKESAEGDAAHWLALMTATGCAHLTGLGLSAPNGVKIDQDMIDGAELFAEVVGPGAVHEKSVAIAGIHPHCFGTPDARRTEPKRLRVFDYKYGHRYVDPFELWQVIAYILGVIETELGGVCPDEVEIIVVQPRAYHPEGPVQTWIYRPDEFRALVARMHKAAHAAVTVSGIPHPNAPATTGPSCGDCKGRHECTALQNVAARVVDAEAVRIDRFNLPPAQLAAELSYLDAALERLEARRDGLAIQGEAHVRAGLSVPGYGMESGQSREAWRDDVSVPEVTALGATFEAALAAPAKLLTPTQARAELKRKRLPPDLLDGYAMRPPGAMKFTKSSTIHARKAFGAIRK